MRKIILAFLFVAMALLSACVGVKKDKYLQKTEAIEGQIEENTNGKGEEAKKRKEAEKAEGSKETEKTEEAEETEEAEQDSPPIDIEYVSYESPISWQDAIYEHDQYSVSYPENWKAIDGEEQGLVNGTFFIPPEADEDNFRFDCHIAIEATDVMFDKDEYDFSESSIQKDFFALMIIRTYSKMGGLSDLKFSVWQNEDDFIYITDYKRSNETLTMYQTTYYVMGKDKSYIVYATTFEEDAEIPVQEAARHLITTLAPK